MLTSLILTSSAADLVNKGPMAEMIAGLELHRYQSPNVRRELFFWIRDAKNSLAEIDYVLTKMMTIIPMEVKAGVRGGMKSLWIFMREKQLNKGIRCSLENFGRLTYTDPEASDSVREVGICPVYAISMLPKMIERLINSH